MIIFDDATSHGWTVNLKQKSDAAPAIQQFIAMVKTQYGLLIKEVQINAGGEFKSQELTLFLQEQGINILTSIPHMHQQNGRTERFICTVMDKAQAMHLDACLSQSWWDFAVDCATHVYNPTPVQRHDWKMPFENLKCIKSDVTHLHVFRCGTYVFLLEEVHVNKPNPKSELMTFLGYPQGTKGYLCMRGPNNMLFMAVQALFNETLFPKCLDMRHLGYTPVAPVNAQGEYNIPLEDNENGDDGGAPFGPAPPGRHVPDEAPPPLLLKNQGKGKNLLPLVLPEPTPPGSAPSESLSDDFYAPKTPSWRSPSRDDLNSSHKFSNPNPEPCFDPMIRRSFFTRTRLIHLLCPGLDIIIQGMEGSCPGIGIIPGLTAETQSPLWGMLQQNGINLVATLIYMILSSKNSFDSKGHIRHHPHLLGQGNQ